MQDTMNEIATGEILNVLKEAFEGAGESSYFTDSGPEAGLFGTVASLDAATASRPLGGSSIAAHVHHVNFGLEVSAAWIRGDRAQRDWNESWSVARVDESRWSDLRQTLQARYTELLDAVEEHSADGTESMGGTVGALAHVAYHLGAIRQKIAVTRD